MRDRLKLFLPLLVFVVLAIVFWQVLKREHYDPQYLPSALIDKPVPAFELPSLDNEPLSADLLANGQPVLLNVWATWCISCRVEHPYLNQLKQQGVRIIGLNYKDDADKARQWLEKLGNPYTQNIVDADGRLGLDLGVYGAPETYLVDGNGVIRLKHVGVVDENVWRDTIEPVYQQWRGR